MTTCPVFKARILSPVNPLPAVAQIEPVVPSFLRELRISCGALQLSASIRSFICFSSPSTNFQRTMRSDLSAHKPSSGASRSRTPRSNVNVNRTSKGSLPFPERTIDWILQRLESYDLKKGSRMHRLEMKCEEMLCEVSEFRQRWSGFWASKQCSRQTYAHPHYIQGRASRRTWSETSSLRGQEGGHRAARPGHGRQELSKGGTSRQSRSQRQDRGNTAGRSGPENRGTKVTHGSQTRSNYEESPEGTATDTRNTHSRRATSAAPDARRRPYHVASETSGPRWEGKVTAKSDKPPQQSTNKTDYSKGRNVDGCASTQQPKDTSTTCKEGAFGDVGPAMKKVSFAPWSLSENNRPKEPKSTNRNHPSVSPLIWSSLSQQGIGGHRR